MRRAAEDPAAGAIAELAQIVGQLRRAWPSTRIVIRGDSGFCREALMSWCEEHGLDYLFRLARNARLVRALGQQLEAARAAHQRTGRPTRRFRDFDYRTRKSWTRTRRVVGKAEHLAKGANPRFVVTSLARRKASARRLYEKLYCARGDMENRIKEQQLDLFADRTSTHEMRSNQLRLYFSSFAYVLLHALRRLGARDTELARAQCGTLRLRLLKVAVRIRITARRVWLSFPQAHPYAAVLAQVLANLRANPCGIPRDAPYGAPHREPVIIGRTPRAPLASTPARPPIRPQNRAAAPSNCPVGE